MEDVEKGKTCKRDFWPVFGRFFIKLDLRGMGV